MQMSHATDTSGTLNGHHPNQQQSEVELAEQLFKMVNEDAFFEAAQAVLENVRDVRTLARCAELIAVRHTGGVYYRSLLWAKIVEALDGAANARQKQGDFALLCSQAGVNRTVALGFATLGTTIADMQKVSPTAEHLRRAPRETFRYAQQQRENAGVYLFEAAQVLERQPHATGTTIHREWCRKHGNRKANLDIIKPSDWWAFSHPKWRQEDDFAGSIPGEVYANALYYFAPNHGVAVDAMAGSGMLKRVYEDRQRWQRDVEFALEIHLFDLYPRRDYIAKHDARLPLPVKADWIFIDPPYYGQSGHLYEGELAAAEGYPEYLGIMRQIVQALASSLNSGGRLCVLAPKWSGRKVEDPNYDVPADLRRLAMAAGLQWIDAAYVSRGRQQEPGSAVKNNSAKRDRRMRSDTCILNVFEKTEEEGV